MTQDPNPSASIDPEAAPPPTIPVGNGAPSLLEALKEGRLYRREGTSPRILTVFVHGSSEHIRRSRGVKCWDFRGFILKLMCEASAPFVRSDLLPFDYDNSLIAKNDLDELSSRLSHRIQECFNERDYESVYVIGHSVGSMLVRKAVLISHDEQGGAAGAWHDAIARLILLSNANRGFEIVRRKNTWRINLLIGVVDFFELRPWILRAGFARLMLGVHRDSPWVKDLRMGWLRRFEGGRGTKEPEAVQIFGKEDQLVGDDDLQETYQFTSVRTLTLEKFFHESFLSPPFPVDGQDWERAEPQFATNYAETLEAITGPITPVIRPTEAPRRTIVFLVHGIRDYADWQENVSYHLRKTFQLLRDARRQPGEDVPDGEIEVVPVRYGYFNAFQFLFPSQRRRSVRAFVDAYYQVLSRFPYLDQEQIHVVAHSNGTFVLGEALKQHREVRLNRVLIAGSVLPRRFDWPALFCRKQVLSIHNDCGDVDWPVGLLCRGLSWIPMIGIGVGGYSGFSRRTLNRGSGVGKLSYLQNNYIKGGHGAGLVVDRHEGIARHILGVEDLPINAERHRVWWFHALHLGFNLLVPAVLLLVLLALSQISKLDGELGHFAFFGMTFALGWGVLLAFAMTVVLIYTLSKI